MNIQRITQGRISARHSIVAMTVLFVMPVLCDRSSASNGLQYTAFDSCISDSCTSGCATEPLTGPTGRPIYQPSEPPVQDNAAPFIQPQAPAAAPSIFAEGVEGTLAAQGHAPGYIDWAIPRTQFRLRFDSGFNNVTPDRAEFFYAQCGCNPGAPGPGVPAPVPTVNGSVDYQDIRGYLEIASGRRFSVFGEVPVRFLQASPAPGLGLPDTGNAAGISDLEAGFKYALLRDADSIFTFQFKTYIPTGNASEGLGTNHVSLEPGFLAQQRINSRLDVFGELRDWIPVNGSTFAGKNYAGNILRYGVGAAYTVADTRSFRFSPVVEFVGWSVLGGQVLNTAGTGASVESAATTIVNLKAGVRTLFKSNGSTLYLGYGHALTGPRWYEDLVRVEYTIFL